MKDTPVGIIAALDALRLNEAIILLDIAAIIFPATGWAPAIVTSGAFIVCPGVDGDDTGSVPNFVTTAVLVKLKLLKLVEAIVIVFPSPAVFAISAVNIR